MVSHGVRFHFEVCSLMNYELHSVKQFAVKITSEITASGTTINSTYSLKLHSWP